MSELPEGILLIDKPLHLTSFDVIRNLRRKLNVKKIGHAGTLDPLATGLMIVGVGAGTKQLRHYVELNKVYVAEICIGESSTTDDKEGEIIAEKTVDGLSEEAIAKALQSMQGKMILPVSVYSAMKKGGEAFYKKARRGEKVTPPNREMEILGTKLFNIRENKNRLYVTAEFFVGSGTYIRSLAVELGRRLGYPARLENLRRTQVGDFRIEDADKIE
jgi:tRNA pseudouridine55 synthase